MGRAVPCLQQWKTFFLGVNELFADRVLTFLHDHLCNGTLDTFFLSSCSNFQLSVFISFPTPAPHPSIMLFLVPVTHFLSGVFAKLLRATVASFVGSGCPSARNNSATTGWIFVKSDI